MEEKKSIDADADDDWSYHKCRTTEELGERHREYWRRVAESDGFDVEGLVIPRGGGLIRIDCQSWTIPPLLRSLVKLYAMVGLHRYNMVKGTNFCLNSLLKFNKMTNCVSSYYITLIAYDPKSRDPREFQVRVDEKTRGNLDMTVSVARPKDEKGDLTKKKKPFSAHYHGGAVAKNVIFKGGLPDWPSDLDLSNTKRFYMLTRQEMQDSDWIFLYLQLVICARNRFVDDTVLDELQIVKVAIETGEDNDERLNAKSAIVYITFMGLVNGAPFIDSDPPPEPQQPNDQSRKRNHDGLIEAQQVKRSARSKRKANKSSEKSYKDGNKEGRWAEQLLNPCALAITARNSSRVQHYLCVLSELASSSGDANHRLAAFGLRALQHHLSSSVSSTSWPVVTFASAEVKMFQNTLLKFYEVSPWFALPNNMANSAILQILAVQDPIDKKDLHILDIGVSHGMQWPTLLEALSCRPEGPPPLVRITVISDLTADIPFSVGPPAYSYGSQLLGFARSLNINLKISVLDKFTLIDTSPHETLIVCAQFRLHHRKHSIRDEVSETLKALRSLRPKGVVLCENNEECTSSGDFAAGFSRKLEDLWKFLDSTSSGFKEENSEERKLMEGEATKVLMNGGYMNEGKDKWNERMRKAGFAAEAFD